MASGLKKGSDNQHVVGGMRLVWRGVGGAPRPPRSTLSCGGKEEIATTMPAVRAATRQQQWL